MVRCFEVLLFSGCAELSAAGDLSAEGAEPQEHCEVYDVYFLWLVSWPSL